MMAPPEIIRLTYCATCGTNDRHRELSNRHYAFGKLCSNPILITIDYLLPAHLGGPKPEENR